MSIVNQNAKVTHESAIPNTGNPPASTALLQPPNSNQKVPINSAKPFLMFIKYYLLTDQVFRCAPFLIVDSGFR